MKQFKRVAETVVDSRRRVSLGKAGVAEETRYAVSVSDDGDILLTPLATIPARERWVWERPELLAALQRGIEQVERGETYYLGSFAQYATDDDDDCRLTFDSPRWPGRRSRSSKQIDRVRRR